MGTEDSHLGFLSTIKYLLGKVTVFGANGMHWMRIFG